VRALIRENKAHQIASIVQTGGQFGMKTMNQALYDLFRAGHVSWEDAINSSSDLPDLERLAQRPGSGATATSAKRR
jgi:twitching motility protein PilT